MLRASALSVVLVATLSSAQRPGQNMTPEQRQKLIEHRQAVETELESVAIIDRKVMVPMRDGKRMATDIYRPKDTSKTYPIIFREPHITSTSGTSAPAPTAIWPPSSTPSSAAMCWWR